MYSLLKIHWSLINGNKDVRVNIYYVINWMTWNDLCNDTFMFYIIIFTGLCDKETSQGRPFKGD